MNGIECAIQVSSMYANDDDTVGGPEITGTVLTTVMGRIEAVPIEVLLLNQGVETGQLYMCTCVPATAIIKNNYKVQVVSPQDHFLYNVPLKVIGVTHTSSRGSRAHLELLLRHVDEST